MAEKTATILGATGLIGSQLLELLKEDKYFDKIKILTRRPLEISHEKIEAIVLDFSDKNEYEKAISGSDFIFCAIGTTMKNVKGDKILYRTIDFDIPIDAANFSQENSATYFGLVSSVGANSNSNNFYLSLKGQVEEALKKMSIPSIGIFRPSMLLGDRGEFRIGELIGKILMKPFAFLMPSHYRPIQAIDVAKAMLCHAKKNKRTQETLHYKQIVDLAKQYDRTG